MPAIDFNGPPSPDFWRVLNEWRKELLRRCPIPAGCQNSEELERQVLVDVIGAPDYTLTIDLLECRVVAVCRPIGDADRDEHEAIVERVCRETNRRLAICTARA